MASPRWADDDGELPPFPETRPPEPTMADRLMSVDPRSVPFFSFQGYSCGALVTQVMNGDTCTLLFPWVGQFCRIVVRLKGVRADGDAGTDWLRKRTRGNPLDVVFDRFEKSGKPLVTLYDPEDGGRTSVNEIMIREGVATRFDGGGGTGRRKRSTE